MESAVCRISFKTVYTHFKYVVILRVGPSYAIEDIVRNETPERMFPDVEQFEPIASVYSLNNMAGSIQRALLLSFVSLVNLSYPNIKFATLRLNQILALDISHFVVILLCIVITCHLAKHKLLSSTSFIKKNLSVLHIR